MCTSGIIWDQLKMMWLKSGSSGRSLLISACLAEFLMRVNLTSPILGPFFWRVTQMNIFDFFSVCNRFMSIRPLPTSSSSKKPDSMFSRSSPIVYAYIIYVAWAKSGFWKIEFFAAMAWFSVWTGSACEHFQTSLFQQHTQNSVHTQQSLEHAVHRRNCPSTLCTAFLLAKSYQNLT